MTQKMERPQKKILKIMPLFWSILLANSVILVLNYKRRLRLGEGSFELKIDTKALKKLSTFAYFEFKKMIDALSGGGHPGDFSFEIGNFYW